YAAADKALVDANANGLITPTELTALTEARDAAIAAKAEAQTKVTALPAEVQLAKDALQVRLDKLVDIDLPEVTEGLFVAADNDVQLVLDIDPTVITNNNPSALNSTGFTVGAVGLGPVLNASILESIFSSSVQLSVAEGTTRDISFNADAGGLTVGTMDLYIYKLNETTGEWEQKEVLKNWYTVVLGGVSPTVQRELDDGEWLFVLGNGAGLSLVTGYTLRFTEDKVNDFNNPTAVTGIISGNVISDIDYQNGQDVVPVGSKITGITSNGNTEAVSDSGQTSIEGKYGTLTINKDGTFSYTVKSDFRKYGEVDSFTYEVTAPNGDKTTAKLNIELTRFASDEEAIIDNTVLLNVTPEYSELTGTDIEISNATAISVLDLGIAGDVLSASIIGTEGVMDFTVAEGTTQNISFSGAAGGLTLASEFSFVIYRLNETTGQLVQVHEIPKFVQVLLLGGTAQDVTLSFGEGTYVGIIKQTSGVNVIGGATASVEKVEVYDYSKPTTFEGSVAGDVTPEATDTLLKVNDQLFIEGQAVTVVGQYGTLVIKADGTYAYDVAVPSDTSTWKPPYGAVDRFEVVVKKADGQSVIEVLNIKLDTNTAANDSNEVNVVANTFSSISVEANIPAISLSSSEKLEFNIQEDAYAKSINLKGSITSSFFIRTVNVEVIQTVNGVDTVVYDGPASIASGSFTLDIQRSNGSTFEAGDYKVNINSINSYITDASITATVFNDISSVTAPPTNGDLFANDQATGQIDILKIGSKELYINDPAKGGNQFTVEGKYGVLTVNKDGTYEYQASGESGGLETFTYTTISKAGSVQTATLEINVGMTLTGSSESETVNASASVDTFTLGAGADTVVYDVLNQALDQNKPDVWTDFSVTQGDKIDVTALLQDQNVTANNIGDYVTVEKRGNDTVVKIDRDAQETKYNPTELLVLKNTDVTNLGLDEFLKYNQI
ncbi:MAG: VCBS domain-containing protein, partial [Candidatus Acinetobacter avistercoris]|nr:VCBS domain-containing protein [Candidatus Acinetobacter avistercoris]